MEGAGDFQALRAKFQNDSNFSNALLQPTNKPPVGIIPGQSTNNASSTKPKVLSRVYIPNPEQKTETTSQKSEIARIKPIALPRIRLRELSEFHKNEDEKHKDLLQTLNTETVPVTDPPKHQPISCIQSDEDSVANNSFRHTLHIWKNAFSCNDQKCSTLPLQHTNKAAPNAQLKSDNFAVIEEDRAKKSDNFTVIEEDRAKITGNKQRLIFAASANPPHLHSEPVPFPAISPPVPPRSITSLEKKTNETINVTGSTQNTFDSDIPKKQHCLKEVKIPKNKPLPSIVSLGPPPKKPPRPPKVDLSAFHSKLLDAIDDEYLPPANTPETPETGEENSYEETVSYLKQPENSSCSNVGQETTHSSKTGKMETIKNHFLTATHSTETDDELERRVLHNNESSKQQAAEERVKIGDDGDIFVKEGTIGESFVGKNMLQKGTVQNFTEQFLEKDRNDGYVCLQALKVNEEQAALGPRPGRALEELYDDVEGLEREFQVSDNFSPFTFHSVSDNTFEETYEDVQSEDCKSTKSDSDKVEKLKKFGKIFKKEKFKMKNIQQKENICNLSSSVPNLDVMTQEDMVYDDVNMEENDTKEKIEMHKNWKLRFLASKEKDRRRNSEDADINVSSRNLFKVKKYKVGKHNKMAKEEKLFRERFMYTKEIKVINTAVAHCSNTLTKRKLDLRITAGEQLEVIDIAEGNQLICRNSEGTYGFVLLEHLNFSSSPVLFE